MGARDDIADVLIIGSGATGSIAAKVLGEAGLRVVCLEQGGWIEPRDHPHYSPDWQWQRRSLPDRCARRSRSARPDRARDVDRACRAHRQRREAARW